MAGLIVGPITDKFIETCFEFLKEHFRRHIRIEMDLERLRDNHPKIQVIVSAAGEADTIDQDEPLNKWIWQLRDAIDEADDLLDEFAYMEHDKRLAKNKERTKVRSYFEILKESPNKIRKICDGIFKTDPKTNSILERLEKILRKFNIIIDEAGSFLYLINMINKEKQQVLVNAREEGSMLDSNLIGRGEEKEKIIQFLRRPYQADNIAHNLYTNISLLSIVGHGGMGKTSLQQLVYQDEMTREFDLKMWVCVSNYFDVKKVIADMLESPKMNRQTIDTLQESLRSKVMSKRFLLVLDDIWGEERDKNKWKKVFAPLAYGSSGSKILITTRMDSVASMISKVIQKKIEKLSIEGLPENECLLLLNTHAFANEDNPDEHQNLKSIAGKLVKKLFGSPLAAKVMGGVLNNKLDESHWTAVLNKALVHEDISSILKLSYRFLPKELQNCFAFCSIFPQDYEFDRDDLVRMWIAVGLIQSSDVQDGEDLEDVGRKYFDRLVQKSFFDKDNKGNSSECYKMHDLMHDVARSISTCFRFEGDMGLSTRVPETTIRHLSVNTSNVEVLRDLGKFKNLRTLWITRDENIEDFDDELTKIFKETRSIRLLRIDNYRPKLMPDTIGHLIHLRYLRLDFDDLPQFPIPLCSLYHLQFIIHNNNGDSHKQSDFFPREMSSNLSNLRHMSFDSLRFRRTSRR